MPVVFYDASSGLDLYVQFDDDDDTAVPMTEGASAKLRRYVAEDADILAASLPAGNYHPSVRDGDYSSPQTDDEIKGVGTFNWNGSQEVVGGAAALSDLSSEPINTNRVFTLVYGSNGLESEDEKTLIAGAAATWYGVEFRNAASSSQVILTVDSVELVEGEVGGLVIGATRQRDGDTQARFTLAGVAAGSYRVRVQVTMSYGIVATGDIRIVVRA